MSILFEAALDEVITILESEDSTIPFSRVETAVSGWFGSKADSKLADKLESEIPCLAAQHQYIETFATY